jgi:hypothetical protein
MEKVAALQLLILAIKRKLYTLLYVCREKQGLAAIHSISIYMKNIDNSQPVQPQNNSSIIFEGRKVVLKSIAGNWTMPRP